MLDKNGYSRQTYEEIKESILTRYVQLFGSDIDTSDQSIFGMFSALMAYMISEDYENAEMVINGAFVEYATGTQLDKLGANYGVSRTPSSYAEVELSFTGTPTYIIEEGSLFATATNLQFEMIDEVTLDSNGNGTGTAVSVENSSNYNVPENLEWTALEPSSNINSITNISGAVGGAEIESDLAYSNRIKQTLKGKNNSSINGILTEVTAVPGVLSANLIDNKTKATDSNGNPPNSVHLYVYGGKDSDIAQALLNTVSPGIEQIGQQTIHINDVTGKDRIINFDRATVTPIYMSIKLVTNDKFADNGSDLIKSAIVQGTGDLNMGSTLIYTKLYSYIYSIDGVADVQLSIGKSAEELGQVDIQAEESEVLKVSVENIEVIK